MKKLNKFALVAVILVLVGIYLNYREKELDINATLDPQATISIIQSRGDISLSDSRNEGATGMVTYKGTKPKFFTSNDKIVLNSNTSSVKKTTLLLPTSTTYSSIDISTGAGNISLPLKNIPVEKVNIQSGAANIDITLPGQIDSEIALNIGAGNIHFIVPKESNLDGIKIISMNDTAINMKGNDAFEQVEEGIYQTKHFEDAKVISTIYLSVGSASFKFSLEE